ncbi:ATPase component of various ABC-type transport system, containing duplicated ATPase [Hoeflea phototrophica DFL-43]|jgi:peptide/nickel transport system ATP-binding protein|uniref:ATPase component of various ABC-type transport system, containing duplicated ATPase n=1 Tax=Hoeflea phototrophica (strain DSM 17068 / NCIMB 14078 / DFL-43) TaxID=411684 RepID=A9DF06_HOEPD|nr:ATP-binding cassette domain-containing protein [Hoeflea phototrophica]EDQ31871.1 ATPase component of various ABC-type transport system, containing duplicated ATPase [Hoeflea phototrophica DFL-43]
MALDDSIFSIASLEVALPDMAAKPVFGRAPLISILKGINLEITRGTVLGIVGGSGSGKSTLGRALLRLIEPTNGTIRFDGRDITHLGEDELRPIRRQMQMIFQDPMSSLNPRRRVGAIIADPLALHGFDGIDGRIDDALDHVGLPRSFKSRYPHELSGGQRQRVGIARAIALKPEFILADEIVSGLDVSSQAQVLNVLGSLVKELGLTLAFISHDLSVIRRLCDRVMVLNRGEIAEFANTDELFASPKSDYTRELMDAIPLPDPDQANW